jgi:acetyl-CoA carboxylase biotin carboxyl carrier protein
MAEYTVRSPLPGVFYRRPGPDQQPFAEVGSSVSAGQAIGLVEIMKQYSEIKTEVAGIVTAFLAGNEAVIGAGDPIATIEAG